MTHRKILQSLVAAGALVLAVAIVLFAIVCTQPVRDNADGGLVETEVMQP